MSRCWRLAWAIGIALAPRWVGAEPLEDAVRAVLARQSPRPFVGVVLIASGDTPPRLIAQGVPDESRFVIGSLSKQMTAALVLRAEESGRLSLDVPLSSVLPAVKDEWASRVSVRQLLNHTSGVVARGQVLRTPPGEVFAYSNGGYDLLGEVLEAVNHERLSKQFAAMFAQCGMRDAGVAGDVGREPVAGFVEADDGHLLPASPTTQTDHAASGGVVAGAADLLRWTQCLYGSRLLSETSLRGMTRPDAKREHRWGSLGYGYGLQIAETPLGLEYSHSGYVPGYLSMLIYYPRERITLAVLENTSWNAADGGRAFYFHDALRGLVHQTAWPQPSK